MVIGEKRKSSRSVLIVIGLFLTLVDGRPREQAKILNYSSDSTKDGYDFKFETSDGIKREESGTYVRQSGQEDLILYVNGKFKFSHPDGYETSVVFVADDKGFRPKVIFKKTEDKTVEIDLDNRINIVSKGISSSALASLAGGGLGK